MKKFVLPVAVAGIIAAGGLAYAQSLDSRPAHDHEHADHGHHAQHGASHVSDSVVIRAYQAANDRMHADGDRVYRPRRR